MYACNELLRVESGVRVEHQPGEGGGGRCIIYDDILDTSRSAAALNCPRMGLTLLLWDDETRARAGARYLAL